VESRFVATVAETRTSGAARVSVAETRTSGV